MKIAIDITINRLSSFFFWQFKDVVRRVLAAQMWQTFLNEWMNETSSGGFDGWIFIFSAKSETMQSYIRMYHFPIRRYVEIGFGAFPHWRVRLALNAHCTNWQFQYVSTTTPFSIANIRMSSSSNSPLNATSPPKQVSLRSAISFRWRSSHDQCVGSWVCLLNVLVRRQRKAIPLTWRAEKYRRRI